jgi:hypothetical protein
MRWDLDTDQRRRLGCTIDGGAGAAPNVQAGIGDGGQQVDLKQSTSCWRDTPECNHLSQVAQPCGHQFRASSADTSA